jgi:hypothetical protein
MTRDFVMNTDVLAAYQRKEWTVYGELGRQPLSSGTRVDSWEHWVRYQSQKGLGLRAGRFLPAYGIRFADHTAFNRQPLGLDTFDQLYALELSHTNDHHLVQVAASPGRADSILNDDGLRAFTAGRVQLDLHPTVLVVRLRGRRRAAANGSPGSRWVALTRRSPSGRVTRSSSRARPARAYRRERDGLRGLPRVAEGLTPVAHAPGRYVRRRIPDRVRAQLAPATHQTRPVHYRVGAASSTP